MNEVFALAVKDLRLLFRDRVGFFFTFFFPLLYAVFFGSIFAGQGGGASPLRTVLVDEDGTDASRAFVRELDESSELEVSVAGRNEAIDQVRRGRRTAYIVLPAGFGKSRERIFGGEQVRLEMGVDPSRSAETGLLQGVLTKYLYKGIQDVFTDQDRMRKQIAESMREVEASTDMNPVSRAALQLFLPALDHFLVTLPKGEDGTAGTGWQSFEIDTKAVTVSRSGPQNSYEISFPQAIIWGVMGCAAAFGISLVTERTKGTLLRLRIAPIARSHILAGKSLACLFTTVAVIVALLLVAFAAFGVRPDSWVLLSASIVSIAICFVGIMMFLSILGKTEQSAGGIGWAVLMVMAMIGGGMIPLFVMPGWLRSLSHVSPVKWSILSLEGAIWRNFSAAEMALPCGILVAVGAVCFVVGIRAFAWTEEG